MRAEMEWGQAKQAGFRLAALLADDQELARVQVALGPETRAALVSTLATDPSREAKARAIAAWLRLLRPQVDATALQLPARIRGVLARSAPAPLKAQLLAQGRQVRE